MRRLFRRFNEKFAVLATRGFGAMPMFYLLVAYGLLPVQFPTEQNTLLYWSNVIQLVALPLLAVGQQVIGRAAVAQAQETHDAVIEALGLVREEVQMLREERELLRQALAAAGISLPAPADVSAPARVGAAQ